MAWAAIDPDGMLAIGAAKNEHHLCQQIPGCNFGKGDKIWRAPLSWATYVAFRTVWASQPCTESGQLLEWAANAWHDVQIAYALRSSIDAPAGIRAELAAIEPRSMRASDDAPVIITERVLTPPQRGGVAWLVLMKRCGLLDPRGNGKQPQLWRALQILHRRGELNTGNPALMVCTGAALLGFRDALASWAPELSVQPVIGTALKRKEALEVDADVYLLAWPNLRLHTRLANYPGQAFVRCPQHGGIDERVTPARCEVHEKELDRFRFSAVITDEAHRMQDARSKQTRAAWYLAQRAPYYWAVTGHGIGDTISDYWPILHAIDKKLAPARSRYIDLFAIKNWQWQGGQEILDIRPDTAAAYHSIVQPTFRRIPREIARPWSPPVWPPEFRYPEMTPEQARLYKEVAKRAIAELDGATMVPANSGVKFSRLCQLASSSILLRDGEDPYGFTTQEVELALPSNKVTDLADVLEDNPGPLIVAANSPRLIALAERKLADLKITYCRITGGMSEAEKNQSERWFQDGQCRVIFLQPKAGGESITLTASSTVCFMQPTPVFRDRDQVIGRADRMGQPYPVRQIHMITPGTVDERMYSLGCEKEERIGNFHRDPDLLRWIIGGGEDLGRQVQQAAP